MQAIYLVRIFYPDGGTSDHAVGATMNGEKIVSIGAFRETVTIERSGNSCGNFMIAKFHGLPYLAYYSEDK